MNFKLNWKLITEVDEIPFLISVNQKRKKRRDASVKCKTRIKTHIMDGIAFDICIGNFWVAALDCVA